MNVRGTKVWFYAEAWRIVIAVVCPAVGISCLRRMCMIGDKLSHVAQQV